MGILPLERGRAEDRGAARQATVSRLDVDSVTVDGPATFAARRLTARDANRRRRPVWLCDAVRDADAARSHPRRPPPPRWPTRSTAPPAWITAATWRSLRAVVTRLRADALAAVDRDGPTAAAEALGVARSTLDRWRVTWLRAPQDAAQGAQRRARVIGQGICTTREDRGACARMAQGMDASRQKTNARHSGEVRGVDGGRNVVAARRVATLPAPARGVHVAHHVAGRDRVRREARTRARGARRRRARRGCPRARVRRGSRNPMARSVAAPTIPSASRSWARCHRRDGAGRVPTSSRIARIARRAVVPLASHDEGQAHRPARGAWSRPSTWRRRCAPNPGWGLQPAPPNYELGAHDAPARRGGPCAREVSIRPARVRHRISPRGLVRGVVLRPVQRHRRLRPSHASWVSACPSP